MGQLDQDILTALAADASTPTSQLSRRFNVARSTVQARIDRLKSTGIIAGYTIRLGNAELARRIKATVLLTIEPRTQPAVLQRLKPMPEVERVLTTTGRFDLIVQIAATSTTELDTVLDKIGATPGVQASESLIHLSTKIDRAV